MPWPRTQLYTGENLGKLAVKLADPST